MGTRLQPNIAIDPPVQTPFQAERPTRDGRTLRYCATILQEPERARACGSGQKSTNDRRPVDPPPVIELRVFESYNGVERDITFTHNANFIMYVSLVTARNICHGRVTNAAATSTPVLTGVPCSNMALLDRPSEAGYFLFPDLSVRHEGRYRLQFTLYEETKEVRDEHPDDDPNEPAAFIFRLGIESEPFTVFSAKKFPGLKESTTLSRNLSDQGVRVRIRRDVRMRRRDGKGGSGRAGDAAGNNAPKPEPEPDFPRRPQQAPTPEGSQPPGDPHQHYRHRSSSAASDHKAALDAAARRPSGAEYPLAPQPPPPAGNYRRSGMSTTRGVGYGQQQYPPPPMQSPTTSTAGHHAHIRPSPGPGASYQHSEPASPAYPPRTTTPSQQTRLGANHVSQTSRDKLPSLANLLLHAPDGASGSQHGHTESVNLPRLQYPQFPPPIIDVDPNPGEPAEELLPSGSKRKEREERPWNAPGSTPRRPCVQAAQQKPSRAERNFVVTEAPAVAMGWTDANRVKKVLVSGPFEN